MVAKRVILGVLATLAAAPSVAQDRAVHKGYVELGSGLYLREDEDLALGTPLPFVLRRTYLSGDHVSRRFGVGTTHPGEWFLHGNNDPAIPWVELIREHGDRVRFEHIAGTSMFDAVLRHDGTPKEFDGAILHWDDGLRWIIRMPDGSKYWFRSCAGPTVPCSIVEHRDVRGNSVIFERDRAGTLLSIASDGQRITFEYDDQRRITRAKDTQGNSVSYLYDSGGRLTQSTTSVGIVRRYAYDERDLLTRIEQPGRIVENQYDASGRMVHQEVRDAPDDNEPLIFSNSYVVEGDKVVQTTAAANDGTRSILRFGADHAKVSETFEADGLPPVTVTYERDAAKDEVKSLTLTCRAPAGPVSRTYRGVSDVDDLVKEAFARLYCTAPR